MVFQRYLYMNCSLGVVEIYYQVSYSEFFPVFGNLQQIFRNVLRISGKSAGPLGHFGGAKELSKTFGKQWNTFLGIPDIEYYFPLMTYYFSWN